MPRHDFLCCYCGFSFSKIVKWDETMIECPDCQEMKAERAYNPGPWTGSTHTGIFIPDFYHAFDKEVESRSELRRLMKENNLEQGSPPPQTEPVRKRPTGAQADQAYWSMRGKDVRKMRERREKLEYDERNS